MTKRCRGWILGALSTAALLAGGVAGPLWAAPPAVSAVPADDPLAGVEDLILAGRHAEAQAAARRAQRIFALRKDRSGEALSVLVLADAELSGGDFAAAAVDFERSASLLEGQGDRFGSWLALWYLGLLERAQRRPGEAITHHRRALAFLSEIEASSEPFSAEALKYLGRTLEMPPRLLAALETRPEDVKPVLLQIAEAMSRTAVVAALLDDGRLEEAEADLSRVTELSRQLGGSFGDEAFVLSGNLRLSQRRLDEAREIFRQALDKRSLSPVREMEVLASLIETEIVSGRHEVALGLCDRASTLARRRGELVHEIALLQVRSTILERSDRLAAAEESLKEALDLARKAGDVHRQGSIEGQLGHLALRAEHPEKAAAHFEAAIPLLQAANVPFEEGKTWLHLSKIYSEIGSRGSAGVALEKARQLARQSRSRLLEAWTELMAAIERLRSDQGNFDEIELRVLAMLSLPEVRGIWRGEDIQGLADLMIGMLQLVKGTGDPPAAPRSDVGQIPDRPSLRGITRVLRGLTQARRGEVAAARNEWLSGLAENPRGEIEVALLAFVGFSYIREGKDEEAIRYFVQGVEVLEQTVEDVRLEEFLAGYLGNERQVLFSDLIDLLARHGRPAEAFDYAERARARGFLQGLGNPRLGSRQGGDSQLVREAEELRRQMLDGERRLVSAPEGDREGIASALREARERYQSLLVRLRVTNPDHASRAKVEPRKLQAIRGELAPGTSLISYFVSSSQVHAWVLDTETFQHVAIPLGPADLRAAVCWADELGRRDGGRGASRLGPPCGLEAARAEDLYEKLFVPLRRYIRHRRLIMVPHGELHYLPFAALRDPKTERYLVEDYTLTYVPSASALGFLRAQETPVEGRALVLGAPEEIDPGLDPLPAAQQEAEVVGRLFGTRPLLGAQATESRLYKLSGKVDLLHIAAHGIYESRSPLFSRIALTPDREHDGNIEVHEILSDLDLSGVNLVVLSACETARGERSRGDEVTGLTRAFLYAGSPGVISTLWNIDDAASAVLMKELYGRLLDGAPAPEALRQAQVSLLKSPRYRQPYYWAAFGLTGDPQGRWAEP